MYELDGRHKDGSVIHLDFRSTRINYYGKPALEAIMVDVTSQRDLQEQIVSNERLRALGEMASGVAHDFNNVLGSILARKKVYRADGGSSQDAPGAWDGLPDRGAVPRRVQRSAAAGRRANARSRAAAPA